MLRELEHRIQTTDANGLAYCHGYLIAIKHRELIKVGPVDRFALHLGVRVPTPSMSNVNVDDHGSEWRAKVVDPHAFFKWVHENTVKSQLTLGDEVTLIDGMPIMDTLDVLGSEVSNLVTRLAF